MAEGEREGGEGGREGEREREGGYRVHIQTNIEENNAFATEVLPAAKINDKYLIRIFIYTPKSYPLQPHSHHRVTLSPIYTPFSAFSTKQPQQLLEPMLSLSLSLSLSRFIHREGHFTINAYQQAKCSIPVAIPPYSIRSK